MGAGTGKRPGSGQIGRRRPGRLRGAIPFLATAGLVALLSASAPVAAHEDHDASEHLLEGSFRASRLRGLLPDPILRDWEQALAHRMGDMDAAGGAELAVVYPDREGRLVLAVLGEREDGDWRKLGEAVKSAAGVGRFEFVTFRHGEPSLLFVQWMLADDPASGQLEVFALRDGGRRLASMLVAPVTTTRLEDVDGDRVADLIVRSDQDGIAGIPLVFSWDGDRFHEPASGLRSFYVREAERYAKKGETIARQTPRRTPVPLHGLDNLLNAAKCFELADRKYDAFRTYRRVASLARAGFVRRRLADEAQALRERRANAALEGMERMMEKDETLKPRTGLVPRPGDASEPTTSSTTAAGATTPSAEEAGLEPLSATETEPTTPPGD